MAGSVLRRGKSLSCGCDIPKRISEKLYKDRVGQRFGELVILKRVENHPTMGIMFLCRCDCGNEKVISRVAIVSHGQRNCGCKLGGFVDLTGKKFNRWTVLTMFRDENNNIKWISECECGNIGIHSSYELTSGSSKSCGCYDYERKLQFECLEGKKFGRWIVISDKRNKNGERETICQCECGTIKPVDVGNLKKSISKYCECYRVEFIKSKTGKNSLIGKVERHL